MLTLFFNWKQADGFGASDPMSTVYVGEANIGGRKRLAGGL
jgi:hypothetical protein